jgi:signal transduction histidine kinase/CheY-like chemotaxis protein
VEDFFTLLKVVKKIEYYEAELVTVKGTHIHTIGHIIGAFSKGGDLLQMRGYLVNNTAHKLLEEELRQTQKMEAIGRLSGGIAHDFNNLLTGIMGYGELLLQSTDAASPLRQYVEEIKKAARSASSLTRQLLAFSRKQVLSLIVLDLNEVILEMHEMLTRLIGETIKLHLDLADHVNHVKADRGQIEQVIMNLVLNSRDALSDGGAITIRTKNAAISEAIRLHNTLLKAGDYAVLEVIDNGSGMSEDTQSHLFEPFFTTKTMGKGVGLGLSTVYGIVTQSAGSPEIISAPNEGTTVRIFLPVHALNTASTDENTAAPVRERFKGRVLVVEDDKNVRELARIILTKRGFDVLLAEDGEKGFRLYQESHDTIDLVVTDVVMPKMSGPDLIRLLQEKTPDLKVIYISGYVSSLAAQQIRPTKDITFLQKPFSPEMLIQAISRVLAGN